MFQNQFLRWNCMLKPVDLSTMNPINKTNLFLSFKGGCRFLKFRTPQQKPLKIKNDILFLKTYMIYHNNYYQPLWKCDFFNFQPTLVDSLQSKTYKAAYLVNKLWAAILANIYFIKLVY